MSDLTTKCSRCGATVSPGCLQGICPACLLALNLSAPTEEFGPEGTHVSRSPLPPGPSVEELASLFPQLEILGPLGRGGMGAVYKARQPRLDRLVALKILLRRDGDPAGGKAFAERFCREARALARLAHPDIVGVYDYGEAGGYPYLIMEYVDGLTLRQLLQRGKLQPEEALAIVPKICDALHFAHQQGVVHRDIKPENILIDKEGRVKIADFGIAKIVHPDIGQQILTGGKDVIGTPHYMAPEQVERPGTVDHRADIFSLGVVFYEMLTGELPLGKFRPPSSKVTVDVRLDEIVLRALEKEPERRYQHISQVKTDVENVSTSSGTLSEAPLPNDARKRARERKSACVAASGLGLGTISMLATATQVSAGLPTFLSVCGAAGMLAAAIHFSKKAWERPQAAVAEGAPASIARVLPPSLVLLCVLMLVQGFYAVLETLLRQQPGLAIFPTSVCMVTGVGLLFLRRWARILALAWVWVSYVLYLVLGLLMVRAQFLWSNVDLKTEIMGRGIEAPRYYVVAVLLFVSAAFMVPWTHWLLTRDHIKRFFGIEGGASQTRRSQKWGFAIGVTVILATLFTWMAMPKRLGAMLSGKVTSVETGKPVQAEIIVMGSKLREGRTTTDRNGCYTIQVPPDAGLLYRDDTGDHFIDPVIAVQAGGFEPADIELGKTRSVSYYKRVYDFQLQPLSQPKE